MSKKAGRRKKVLLIVLLLLLVCAAVVGYLGLTYYNVHKKANFSHKYVLYVYPDMSEAEILDSLEAGAGMVERSFMEKAFETEEAAGRILPGKYVVSTSDPSIYVARMLTHG